MTIRYRLEQDTKSDGLWISEIFEAEHMQHVRQNVIAGFLSGEPRRAVDVDVPGRILYALDSKGKAL